MTCLHCGHCCIFEPRWIIENPKLGYSEVNLIYKHIGQRCKHLIDTDDPLKELCAIYNKPWFRLTECGRTEDRKDAPCLVGLFCLSKKEG